MMMFVIITTVLISEKPNYLKLNQSISQLDPYPPTPPRKIRKKHTNINFKPLPLSPPRPEATVAMEAMASATITMPRQSPLL